MSEEEALSILKDIQENYKYGIKHSSSSTADELATDIKNNEAIEKILNIIEKKDKIIDLMAKWIFDKDYKENSLLIHRDDYYSNCIKQVKEYFKNKVKEN